jgi:hypothetical protein
MNVIIIDQNGNIEDKKYNKEVISQLSTNPLYITEIITYVPLEDCFIYRISHTPDKSEKNVYATNLLSNENIPLYGEILIIKISKNNEIQNIDVDCLMSFIINEMKIDEEKKKERIHDDVESYYNYYDEMEEHSEGYDSY